MMTEIMVDIHAASLVQGRLIPGTRVASVPFLGALRAEAAAGVRCQGRMRDEGLTHVRANPGPSWTVAGA